MNNSADTAMCRGISPWVAAMILCTASAILPMRAETVVAPGAYATTPGEGASRLFRPEGSRSLNIYYASDFAAVMPDGAIITGVAFRLDESEPRSLELRLEATEIRMSTSPVTPDTVSIRFSENVGRDETIVFPQGSVEVQAGGSAVIPYPFELEIPFVTPFYYHPRHGSLAMDVRNIAAGSPRLFDTGGHAISLVGGVSSVEAMHLLGAAIVEFQFTPVTEPSSWKVGLLASALFLFLNLKGKYL